MVQPELLSKAAFKREIENSITKLKGKNQFVNVATYNLSPKQKKLLNDPYRKVKSINTILQKGWTEKIEEAKRMKVIYSSIVISRMARNKIADIDILKEGIISLEEVEFEYSNHSKRSEMIIEMIRKYEFIQKAITEHAKEGKPFKSKNQEEIKEIEEKLEDLENLLASESDVRKMFGSIEKQKLEERLQSLKDDDFLNSEFPIEDICYKIVMDGNSDYSLGCESNNFKRKSFEDSIWYLSKTAQEKIIDLIVKSYKNMYEEEIKEYRLKKNKEHRMESMRKFNKKSLTAEEKQILVQLGKADGLTQMEVAAEIDCSERTVQYYWNTAS